MLEDVVGKLVWEYRAPSFSIVHESLWAIDTLTEERFVHDSSNFPASLHDCYGFSECGTPPFHRPNGLLEIPLVIYKLRNEAGA